MVNIVSQFKLFVWKIDVSSFYHYKVKNSITGDLIWNNFGEKIHKLFWILFVCVSGGSRYEIYIFYIVAGEIKNYNSVKKL